MKDCTNANATMKDCTRRCGVANVVAAPQTRPAAARLSWARLRRRASRAGAVTRSSVRRPQRRSQRGGGVTIRDIVDAHRQARRQEAEARRIAHELERIDAVEAAMGPESAYLCDCRRRECVDEAIAAGLPPPSPAETEALLRRLWAGGGPRPTGLAASASGNAAPAAAAFKEPPTIEGPPPIKAPPPLTLRSKAPPLQPTSKAPSRCQPLPPTSKSSGMPSTSKAFPRCQLWEAALWEAALGGGVSAVPPPCLGSRR